MHWSAYPVMVPLVCGNGGKDNCFRTHVSIIEPKLIFDENILCCGVFVFFPPSEISSTTHSVRNYFSFVDAPLIKKWIKVGYTTNEWVNVKHFPSLQACGYAALSTPPTIRALSTHLRILSLSSGVSSILINDSSVAYQNSGISWAFYPLLRMCDYFPLLDVKYTTHSWVGSLSHCQHHSRL